MAWELGPSQLRRLEKFLAFAIRVTCATKGKWLVPWLAERGHEGSPAGWNSGFFSGGGRWTSECGHSGGAAGFQAPIAPDVCVGLQADPC